MGLDIVEFILAAEKEFDCSLPDDELSLMTTVNEFTNLVHQKLLAKHGFKQKLNNEEVFIKVKALLMKQQGLREQDIFRTSRFMQDLKMD